MKDVDCDNAGDKTDQAGEQNQPPVVLNSETGKYAEHAGRPKIVPAINTPAVFSILLTFCNFPENGYWHVKPDYNSFSNVKILRERIRLSDASS